MLHRSVSVSRAANAWFLAPEFHHSSGSLGLAQALVPSQRHYLINYTKNIAGLTDCALAQKESYFVKERWLNKNVTLKQILVICEGANDESTEQERTD